MRKSQYFPFQCSVLNKGTTGTIFITSLVWRGPWQGIEPGTSRSRSQHSTTRLSRRRYLLVEKELYQTSKRDLSSKFEINVLVLQRNVLVFLFQIYITTKPLPHFPLFVFLLVISHISKLTYSRTIGKHVIHLLMWRVHFSSLYHSKIGNMNSSLLLHLLYYSMFIYTFVASFVCI